MSLGFGILLIVIGAILAFALNVQLDWIDLDLVGYLLMGAGLVVAVVGIVFLVRRRTSVVTERTSPDGTTREVTSETHDSSGTAV